jgi:hypothetical protein
MYKCPHCGLEFDSSYIAGELLPTHDWQPTTKGLEKCPGSGQHPRTVWDRRPLWKDDPDCVGR